MAERFFYDDTGPLAVLFLGEAGLTELLHDGREKSWGDGEIEKPVASGVVLLIDIVDLLRQTLERLGILEVALDVVNTLGEPGPDCGVDLGGGILGDFFRESLAKTFRGEIVAGGAEDDHDAGRGDGVCMDVIHRRVSCPVLASGAS